MVRKDAYIVWLPESAEKTTTLEDQDFIINPSTNKCLRAKMNNCIQQVPGQLVQFTKTNTT